MSGGTSTFLVLETILEENSDELDTSDTESVASCSSSENDVASVIHISPDSGDSGSESERDLAIPKKRRKRELTRLRPPSDDESTTLSRSSSLLQFESLEQAITNGELEAGEDAVFRTSATEKPFSTNSQPPSYSSFSFDSLENQQDSSLNSSIIKDSLEEYSTETSSSESSSESSEDGESYFLDKNKLNLRQSRLRSYRSFDSLLHVVRPSKLSSLSLEANLAEENDIVPELKPNLNLQLKSSENLSEDSGFSEDKKSPIKNIKNIFVTNPFALDIPEENSSMFDDVTQISADVTYENTSALFEESTPILTDQDLQSFDLEHSNENTQFSSNFQPCEAVEELNNVPFEVVPIKINRENDHFENIPSKTSVVVGNHIPRDDYFNVEYSTNFPITIANLPSEQSDVYASNIPNEMIHNGPEMTSQTKSALDIPLIVPKMTYPEIIKKRPIPIKTPTVPMTNAVAITIKSSNIPKYQAHMVTTHQEGGTNDVEGRRGGSQHPASRLKISSSEECNTHRAVKYEPSNWQYGLQLGLGSRHLNSGQVGTNCQATDGNSEAILNSENTGINSGQIDTNSGQIGINSGQIGINSGQVGTNCQATDGNSETILNSGQIGINSENIGINSGHICINSGQIGINSGQIGTNCQTTDGNSETILNSENIGINSGQIGINSGHICINSGQIGTNSQTTGVTSETTLNSENIGINSAQIGITSQTTGVNSETTLNSEKLAIISGLNSEKIQLNNSKKDNKQLKNNQALKSINLYHIEYESDRELSPDTYSSNECQYTSAPNLINTEMTTREVHFEASPPREITEEVIQKIQVGGIPVENTSSSPQQQHKKHHSKFGTFFQRFSFRRNKKTTKSTENLDSPIKSNENLTDAAIDSVERAAAELSNLETIRPTSPPKSRLLGIVGRKKQAQNLPSVAPLGGVHEHDKIDTHSAVAQIENTTSKNECSKKASSLTNLGGIMNVVEINHDYGENTSATLNCNAATAEARAKSMEFLLDEQNKAAILPPENELRKVSERQLSEHELRVQRSLQRLNVPDWYKNSSNQSSFILKRTGSGTKPGGWPGLNSKTTSLSSLQQSPNLQRGKRENTTSPSPVVSPSPQERLSFSYAPFSRWSTSRLNSGPNSTSTSPSGSTRSSFHYRQPYLGWRSQEKLLNSTPTHYRGPAERLAANLLSKPPLPPTVNILPPPTTPQIQHTHAKQENLAEVQSSIKEVTNAIVHYVTEKNLSPANTRPADLSRSPSPRGSKTRVWVESSFVGTRPIDSPQTPQITGDNSTGAPNGYTEPRIGSFMRNSHGEEDKLNFTHQVDDVTASQQQVDDVTSSSHENMADNVSDTSNEEVELSCRPQLRQELTQLLENFGGDSRPSPTIEDVLDSLLGLPSASRSPSPVASPRGSTSYLAANNKAEEGSAHDYDATVRRHSTASNNAGVTGTVEKVKITRRVSFELDTTIQREISLDSAPAEDTVKCRFSKCGKVATLTEARRTFKTCHNCNSHVYCSRECRRNHWEKSHRKTCLNGRIGALCRRVVTACKEHTPSLDALSKLARRGYLANGRGCVKVLFNSAELAERFVTAVSTASINESLLPGEPCYILWSGLLPTEMGNDIYKELLRLCKSYNPDTRLILYVAICVVSEVPSTGAVKWERQLITRCSKIRLHRNYIATEKSFTGDKNLDITRDLDNPETLILTPITSGNKEIVVTNIQRQLRQRGISLRKNFPEVYRKLVAYVERNEQFTPVTIYPRDAVTGRTFMCIIMPEPDPEKLTNIPTDSSRVQTIDIGKDVDLR